ncbi:MAG: phosphodiester glycosidase family protein [Stenomitos frigidus ULC029]
MARSLKWAFSAVVKEAKESVVKPVWLLSAILVGVGITFGFAQYVSFFQPSSSFQPLLTATPSASGLRRDVLPRPVNVPAPETEIEYKSYNLPSSSVHVLWIPAKHVVTPVLVDGLETVETIARKEGAIAVLNGGFFDPENQKSTSFVTVQGKLVADPRLNERLVNNPALAPYLGKILNRSELRRYQCGEKVESAIVRHREPPLTNCQLIDALGGGPQLLPQNTALAEGFIAFDSDRLIRDAIGRNEPNARTAIGRTVNGNSVWVMIAQKPNSPASGMSLEALTKFMQTLDRGINLAMNLDGGSSSSLYYNGKAFYGKVDEAGKPVKRPVKSVLVIRPNR